MVLAVLPGGGRGAVVGNAGVVAAAVAAGMVVVIVVLWVGDGVGGGVGDGVVGGLNGGGVGGGVGTGGSGVGTGGGGVAGFIQVRCPAQHLTSPTILWARGPQERAQCPKVHSCSDPPVS